MTEFDRLSGLLRTSFSREDHRMSQIHFRDIQHTISRSQWHYFCRIYLREGRGASEALGRRMGKIVEVPLSASRLKTEGRPRTENLTDLCADQAFVLCASTISESGEITWLETENGVFNQLQSSASPTPAFSLTDASLFPHRRQLQRREPYPGLDVSKKDLQPQQQAPKVLVVFSNVFRLMVRSDLSKASASRQNLTSGQGKSSLR
ncbi:hypothetical protein KCU71_g82, partial [Aureobasidium melanogenum]